MRKGRRNIFVLLTVVGLLMGSAMVIMTLPTKLGLDLKGGVELTFQGEPTPQSKVTPEAISRSIEVIRKRVDAFGLAEPEIQQSGSDQITVSLPDIKDPQRAASQVGKTAQLYFYDWNKSVIGNPEAPIPGLYIAVKKASKIPEQNYGTTNGIYYIFNKKSKKELTRPDTSVKSLLEKFDGKQPKGSELIKVKRGTVVVRNENRGNSEKAPDQWFILNDHSELSGTDVKDPQQGIDPNNQAPIVTFNFTDKGRKAFAEVTKRIAHRGRDQQVAGENPEQSSQTFAIVLDGEIVSRPQVNFVDNPDGIDGSQGAQIFGNFTIESAQELSKLLQIGALPINLKLISSTQVSATLGKQDLRQALLAGIVGLLLVMIYLISFYRLLGVIAVLALIVYTIFFYAVAKMIPITLTLPSIAGLILTIGVAADANIVIFERIKEEFRGGKSVPSAIASGYSKGFKTIVDANVVTFMTAFILFVLATSGVKGFAYMLGLGIILSMFTAVFATQAVLSSMGNTRILRSPAMLGNVKQRVRWHFNFMGASKWFFSMSGIILLAGAVSFSTNGINAGLDFKGGTRVLVSLDRSATDVQLKESLASLKLKDPKIQKVKDSALGANVYQITAKEIGTGDVVKVKDKLDKSFGVAANGFNSQSVGPTFGDQVKNSAVYAIIFSILAVVVYLTWRFQFKFAIPALIALVHDLLIAFGVYSLTGKTVTTATVAALLTILGYSLYDTVIVFDRVRENVPRMPGATFSQIVNRSMSEVMTRSLNTSISTLIPVAALLFFGGETLKDFAFALLVGIASGTYSSIFIASPVLTAWKEREPLYSRRRASVAAQFGGAIPAFADAATGSGVVAAVAKRAGGKSSEMEDVVEAQEEMLDQIEEAQDEPLIVGKSDVYGSSDESEIEHRSSSSSTPTSGRSSGSGKSTTKRKRKRKKHGRQ